LTHSLAPNESTRLSVRDSFVHRVSGQRLSDFLRRDLRWQGEIPHRLLDRAQLIVALLSIEVPT
jgi:hypothetical protein